MKRSLLAVIPAVLLIHLAASAQPIPPRDGKAVPTIRFGRTN